jgi:hypothetical protein
MAEIKLVFVTKVPHRPAVATIGESAPLLAQRASTARRSPKFARAIASRSSLPRRGRAAATEREMRPDVRVASVDTRLRGNERKVNQLDRDQRWRAATMSAEIEEVDDDEGDDDRGQPEAEYVADVVTRHALPGTRRRYDRRRHDGQWRAPAAARRHSIRCAAAFPSW